MTILKKDKIGTQVMIQGLGMVEVNEQNKALFLRRGRLDLFETQKKENDNSNKKGRGKQARTDVKRVGSRKSSRK